MFSINKNVACTPFPNQKEIKTINSALKFAAHNNALVPLTVVLNEEGMGMPAGCIVYVRGALSAAQFAKEVFIQEDLNEGRPFILVPKDFIVLVKPVGL